MAEHHFDICQDGLHRPWFGRVWLNPPYGDKTGHWLERLAQHRNGIALIFARTETDHFFRYVWERATSILFLRGRLNFHHVDGTRSEHNSGAPSCLVAYGGNNTTALINSRIPGQVVHL
jgi:hypothetical protein